MECRVDEMIIDGRKHVVAVFAVLVVAGLVRADMVPLSTLDTAGQTSVSDCGRADLRHSRAPGLFFPSHADSDFWSVEFPAGQNVHVGQTSQAPQPQILVDNTSSLSLCLYALMGLGLCSSAHWVKKHSLGFIPEWYHNGGPFQIGHSLAVTPDNLSITPARCFVQPVIVAEDLIPIYRSMTVRSLWRESQFTPAVIASRGPPDLV